MLMRKNRFSFRDDHIGECQVCEKHPLPLYSKHDNYSFGWRSRIHNRIGQQQHNNDINKIIMAQSRRRSDEVLPYIVCLGRGPVLMHENVRINVLDTENILPSLPNRAVCLLIKTFLAIFLSELIN